MRDERDESASVDTHILKRPLQQRTRVPPPLAPGCGREAVDVEGVGDELCAEEAGGGGATVGAEFFHALGGGGERGE